MLDRPTDELQSGRFAASDGEARPAAGSWRTDLKNRVVTWGIRVVCGADSTISASAAADVSVVRAGLGMLWLRTLGALGVRSFVSRSGLGHKFVCHVGDLAEHPFYVPNAFRNELALCAAWLEQETAPVAYDVGANVGFFCTQLAQMVAKPTQIYAFEPVPTTFVKLVQSVQRLGLADRVHTIAAAVGEDHEPLQMNYSDGNSLYAQIRSDEPNPRAGSALAYAAAVTLDRFHAAAGATPALIKIDVEGSEIAVLRGAEHLLARVEPPAVMFEYNPMTLAERGASTREFATLLAGYELFYVDDLEGQRLRFGAPVPEVDDIDWICNVFAVPRAAVASGRWAAALARASGRVGAAD
jgi:FkbM family methyltransferase